MTVFGFQFSKSLIPKFNVSMVWTRKRKSLAWAYVPQRVGLGFFCPLSLGHAILMFSPPPCAKEVLWSFPNPQKKFTFSQSVQKNALMNIQLLRKCVQHVKYLNKIYAFLLLAIWALLIVSSWCQLELIWWLPCFFFYSSARVHSSGYPGHGYHLSS